MAVFGKVNYISAESGTVIFVSVLLVLTLFEGLLHILEVQCNKRGLKGLVKKLYREFMIMGFISLAILVVSEAYSYKRDQWFYAFDFAHIVLLFVGITFAVQAALFVALITTRNRTLLFYDLHTAENLLFEFIDMQRRGGLKPWFFTYGPITFPFPILREKIEYKIVQQFFIRIYNLPDNFKFANYICEVLKGYIISLVEVRPITWVAMASIVALNQGRIAWIDPIFAEDICNEYPPKKYRAKEKKYGHYKDYHTCEEYTLRYSIVILCMISVILLIVTFAAEVYIQRLIDKVLDYEQALEIEEEEEGHLDAPASNAKTASRLRSQTISHYRSVKLAYDKEPFIELTNIYDRKNVEGKDAEHRDHSSLRTTELPPSIENVARQIPKPGNQRRSFSYTDASEHAVEMTSIRRPSTENRRFSHEEGEDKVAAAKRRLSHNRRHHSYTGTEDKSNPATHNGSLLASATMTHFSPDDQAILLRSRQPSLPTFPLRRENSILSNSSYQTLEQSSLASLFCCGINRRYLYIRCLERIMHLELAFYARQARRMSIGNENDHPEEPEPAAEPVPQNIQRHASFEQTAQAHHTDLHRRVTFLQHQNDNRRATVGNEEDQHIPRQRSKTHDPPRSETLHIADNDGESGVNHGAEVGVKLRPHYRRWSTMVNFTSPFPQANNVRKSFFRDSLLRTTNPTAYTIGPKLEEEGHRDSLFVFEQDGTTRRNAAGAKSLVTRCCKWWGKCMIKLRKKSKHVVSAIFGHHLGHAPDELAPDHDVQLLQSEFNNIFAFQSPEIFYFCVEFALLLQCMYLAFYATNLAILARDSYNPGLWQVALILPLPMNFFLLKQIIFTACMLKSIVQIDQLVANKICEEAVEERSVKKRLRSLFRDSLRRLGVEKSQWPTFLREEFMMAIDYSVHRGSEDDDEENEEDDDGSEMKRDQLKEKHFDHEMMITEKQMKQLFHSMRIYLTKQSVQRIFLVIDTDKDGLISWEILSSIVFPDLQKRKIKFVKHGDGSHGKQSEGRISFQIKESVNEKALVPKRSSYVRRASYDVLNALKALKQSSESKKAKAKAAEKKQKKTDNSAAASPHDQQPDESPSRTRAHSTHLNVLFPTLEEALPPRGASVDLQQVPRELKRPVSKRDTLGVAQQVLKLLTAASSVESEQNDEGDEDEDLSAAIERLDMALSAVVTNYEPFQLSRNDLLLEGAEDGEDVAEEEDEGVEDVEEGQGESGEEAVDGEVDEDRAGEESSDLSSSSDEAADDFVPPSLSRNSSLGHLPQRGSAHRLNSANDLSSSRVDDYYDV